MVSKSTPEWGVKPVPGQHRMLNGKDYFILWSSLGVGLLVLSAGSFLSDASFTDALLAIIAGSISGSFLLALAGKIGSDHAVPSLVTMRPSFGIRGSYLPAVLNVMQLIGWTTFEIMIMARAAEILVGNSVPFYAWAALFGVVVTVLGLAGPLTVARQWLGKFAVWVVYATSIILVVSLASSTNLAERISAPGSGMNFFSALDIVIAMPVSWMPLVADYNRFAKSSRKALWGTFIGFAITNILFYFGGVMLGVSDVVTIIVAVQAIFFGFLMLVLIVHEADNAFADIYSAAVSAQNIFQQVNQRYLIVGFAAFSTVLAAVIPIQQYEVFLLLIGAVFVPLFGVVLSDYYILKRQKYTQEMMYNPKSVGLPAIAAWGLGALVYYVLSPLSPIFMPQLPPVGATIPSFAVSLLVYLGIMRAIRKQ